MSILPKEFKSRMWKKIILLIIFDLKLMPQTGQDEPSLPFASPPQYVIDKKTGEILLRQRG